jgi:crotonobetainyl-CoA:carnitine CoA-transferase CaiB-like acyl-CoA transferase
MSLIGELLGVARSGAFRKVEPRTPGQRRADKNGERTPMPHHPASTALDHIRVLDLTRVRAGPTCVRQLADWGADVVKIEMPASLEEDGSLGAGRATSDFQNLHRNKRSLTLNLKEREGRDLLFRLVERADVVVENFRPDVKDRLGIGYEALKRVNPRIILASISGFGQDGPYAKRPGFDQIAQGMGGLMSITGEPGRGPMRVGIPVADLSAGLLAAMGILIALIERGKSGEGQWITTSLLQAQIFMLDFQAARWLVEREVPPQTGNEHPTSVPTNLYPTADGAVNIAVSGEVIWRRFAEALGHPEWIEDARFRDQYRRKENRVALNAAIAEVTKAWTSRELVEALLEAGVPSGPAYRVDEVFADPQVRHLGIATEADTLPFGRTRLVGQPLALSRTPTRMAAHPPDRGEHTDEILHELGMGAEEIAGLRARNIV